MGSAEDGGATGSARGAPQDVGGTISMCCTLLCSNEGSTLWPLR